MHHEMKRRGWAAGLVAAALVPSGWAVAAKETPPGMVEFAGKIGQKRMYLFDKQADREMVDELNRKMRESDQRTRRGENDAAREAARQQRAEAAEKLIALLAEHPAVVDVTIEGNRATSALKEKVKLKGDRGAFILRIHAEGEGMRCVTVSDDRAIQSWQIDVPNVGPGVTWAAVSLDHVPAKRTSLLFEFVLGDRRVGWPVDVVTPEFGRVKVTIVDGETGQPTPAMARLVWLTGGEERRPSTAIDHGPQFDRQGRWEGARYPNQPGKLGGAYWCVPEPFDMEVPPGEWEIAIGHGFEYVPIFETFTVEPGQKVEKTYTLERWVDMRKKGWYSGDDHVHCQILSDDDAARLMTWVKAEDLHLTNVVKMGDIGRTWFEQRGWGPAYRVIDGDYILSPGQECPRTHDQLGHTISMKTTSMVRDTDTYYLYDRVADTVHKQGGLWGYAHVLSNSFHVHRDMSINVPKGNVDFIELMQFAGLGTELFYEFLNLGYKVTASAGSDVPWGGSVGEVRIYAYVGDEPFGADSWFEAVRRGRTFTTSGPMLLLRVNQALPGDEIRVAGNESLRVEAAVLGDKRRATPKRIEIIQQGEVIQSGESDGKAETLTVNVEVKPGGGCWIAARAEASDGTKAHTTPVYVVREGLRFWKHDAAKALIAKRRASLREIDQIVADAKRRNDAGEVEADRAVKQLALQGDALLERVEAAKKIYDELEKVHEDEAKVRAKLD